METVTFYKDGQPVEREELLRLEVLRSRHMMALMMRKLGSQGMADLFASEIDEAARREHSWQQNSHGRFVASVAHARVSEGSGVEFVQWFVAGYMGPNAPAMMRAHPEHLGAMPLPDGRIAIIEVPGHTDLPAVLHLRRLEAWPQDVPIELDPTMPVRIMGCLESKDGSVQGYLLHQFRDTSPGFEAKLAIHWLDGTPGALVSGHADHLMLEFNNWLLGYVQTRKQPAELMPVMLAANT